MKVLYISCTFKVAVFPKKNHQDLRLDTSVVIKLLPTFLIFYFKLLFCQCRHLNSPVTTGSLVPQTKLQVLGQMTHIKLYHQLFPNSCLRHEGQSMFHAIYPVHYYRNLVHLWWHIANIEVLLSIFKVKVQSLHDNTVTSANVLSVLVYD